MTAAYGTILPFCWEVIFYKQQKANLKKKKLVTKNIIR